MSLRSLFHLALWIMAIACLASPAQAHFVWIETEPADAGLLVRSGFGEPAGWDPDLIDRMHAARFWRQGAAQLVPLKLKLDDQEREYRGLIDAGQAGAVVGSCDFGVIQFGSNPPSWLRYTAKSLLGAPRDWPRQPAGAELRIELLATMEQGKVRLQASHLGKPLAQAQIKCTSPQGDKLPLTTDADGVAHWPLDEAGLYACYVGVTTPQTGSTGGKAYEALKDYTTLTFKISESDLPKP